MLDAAGPSARAVAWLWWGMFVGFTLVLLMMVGLWLLAVRRDPGTADDAQARRVQNRWIIGGGLVLPTVSIIVVLAFGIPVGHGMLPWPSTDGEVLRIDVTARQWRWDVRYPDSGIALEDELHIPAGQPVDVHLTSEDVIHSFWVPRLGGKLDMFPGRTNVLRLQADVPGQYRGQCAEFCGLGHAHMQFVVHAHDADDYAAWAAEAGR